MFMVRRFVILIATVGAAFGVSSPACAYDWAVEGRVVTLEGSNMPQYVPFALDVPAGSCSAGTFLQWNIKGTDTPSRIANAQYVASILLTAKSTGKLVKIFGNNTGCTVDFIWAE